MNKQSDQKKVFSSSKRPSWWRWLLAFVLFTALIYSAGPETLMDLFFKIQPAWALTAVVLSYSMYLIGSLNVWILLRSLDPFPLGRFVRIYMTSWAVGLLLPGQLGDASQVVFLKRQGVQMARSGAAYALDKGLSLFLFIIIAAVGATHYLISISGVLWALIPVSILTVVGISLAVRLWKKPESGILARIHEGLSSFFHHLWSFRNRWPIVLENFTITVIRWVLQTLCFWAAFRAFGAPISLFAAATIPVISTLVGYIPISVAGIGTVELSAVLLFEMEGIAKAQVLAAYLMLRLALYLLAGLCLLFLKWETDVSGTATRFANKAGPRE
jgi:uncharacterized membrane protein YbhN (UPF0104 family)